MGHAVPRRPAGVGGRPRPTFAIHPTITVRPARRFLRGDGWEWYVNENPLFVTREVWRFCKRQDDAWRKARARIDRLRAANAEHEVRAMQTRTERVPL